MPDQALSSPTGHDARQPLTVHVPREVDGDNEALVRGDLLAAIDTCSTGPGVLVIDLTHTKFIDSAGLRAILAARNHAAEFGAPTCVATPSEDVRRFITLVDITGHMPMFDSVDAALASWSA